MGDADDSYDFLEIPKFVERLREGYDLVQGCRLPWGGGLQAMLDGKLDAYIRPAGIGAASVEQLDVARRLSSISVSEILMEAAFCE